MQDRRVQASVFVCFHVTTAIHKGRYLSGKAGAVGECLSQHSPLSLNPEINLIAPSNPPLAPPPSINLSITTKAAGHKDPEQEGRLGSDLLRHR